MHCERITKIEEVMDTIHSTEEKQFHKQEQQGWRQEGQQGDGSKKDAKKEGSSSKSHTKDRGSKKHESQKSLSILGKPGKSSPSVEESTNKGTSSHSKAEFSQPRVTGRNDLKKHVAGHGEGHGKGKGVDRQGSYPAEEVRDPPGKKAEESTADTSGMTKHGQGEYYDPNSLEDFKKKKNTKTLDQGQGQAGAPAWSITQTAASSSSEYGSKTPSPPNPNLLQAPPRADKRKDRLTSQSKAEAQKRFLEDKRKREAESDATMEKAKRDKDKRAADA
ncbi:hypothetical protein BKA64DRAFT_776464 [Cadophora sp. MPI-SDFR-AT-0126]|nr:hypothetical protein BKA64DRAFT_776464 [Leotiomycetes sp. MPI-SDFR-AT-0126]